MTTENSRRAVVVLSGGQDSMTALFWALKEFSFVCAISFNYHQKHSVEIEQAKMICKQNDIPHAIIDLTGFTMVSDSALVNSTIDISQKREEDGLPASFTPNRNQVFITLAHSHAQRMNCGNIVLGVCQTDYSGYPDCRMDYIQAIQQTTNLGSFGSVYDSRRIKIHTPIMYLTKAATFAMAQDLDVLDEIIEHSHTCYNGNRQKKNKWGYGCGECPACKVREKGWIEYQDAIAMR